MTDEDAKILADIGYHLDAAADLIHRFNAKWWVDPYTGERLNRNVGEMLMLVVSEVAEAMEGHRKNLPDDKLPHHQMFTVELADTLHRIFDISGGLKLPLGSAFVEKARYNLTRADHSLEARKAPNGKKY